MLRVIIITVFSLLIVFLWHESDSPMAPQLQIRAPSESTDRENYTHFDDNPVKRVSEHPVSTFSIDVDTGSYSNVRRMHGQFECWRLNQWRGGHTSRLCRRKTSVRMALIASYWQPMAILMSAPSHSALKNLIEEKRKTGISLTTLGFGMGNYNDHLMEQ